MNDNTKLDERPLGVGGSGTLKPDEFGVFLGLASWLMSMSKDHKDLPFTTLDTRILPAILLKQFRLIRKDEMPVAFVAWALVSEDIKEQWKSGEKDALTLQEWRSGKQLLIVDCVSPFAPAAQVKEQFIKDFMKTAVARQKG